MDFPPWADTPQDDEQLLDAPEGDAARLLIVDDGSDRVDSAFAALTTVAPGVKSGFDRVFLRRFKFLVKLGFKSGTSRLACRVYGIWAVSLISSLMMLSVLLVIGPFVAAIVAAETRAILTTVAIGSGLYAVESMLLAGTLYFAERVSRAQPSSDKPASCSSVATGLQQVRLDWRAELVKQMHAKYFTGRKAYWLNTVDARVRA